MKFKALFYLMVFSCCSTQASAWAYLATSPAGNESYAMSISGTKLFPVVWFKIVSPHGQTLSLSKDVIDCNKGKYSVREVNHYAESGKIMGGDSYILHHWKEITPDSMASYEYKFACHRALF